MSRFARTLLFAIGLLNLVAGYVASIQLDGPTLPPPVDENVSS